MLSGAFSSRAIAPSNPGSNYWALACKTSCTQLVPELGGIVTSLVPTLFQVLAVFVDSRFSVADLPFRKSASTYPTANRPYAEAAARGNFALGDAFRNLLHSCLIAFEATFTIMLLLLMVSRYRLGYGRSQNRRSGRRLCLAGRGLSYLSANKRWWGTRAPVRASLRL